MTDSSVFRPARTADLCGSILYGLAGPGTIIAHSKLINSSNTIPTDPQFGLLPYLKFVLAYPRVLTNLGGTAPESLSMKNISESHP